ncbi:MAG: hypothetical protein U0269_07490 [Polyangiales bacterium]
MASMVRFRSVSTRVACVSLALVAACSQGPSGGDAASDASPDASRDVISSADSAADAMVDAAVSDGADASARDSAADGAMDSAIDASADAAVDSGRDASADAPTDAGALRPLWLATVEQEGPRPALYVQRPDGTERRRLRFDRVTNSIPDNVDPVLEVRDDRIIAMPYLTFSPDGGQLAVVLSVAHDESQIIVLDLAAGTGRVASLNMQYIMGPAAWSADGNTLAYAMNVALPITQRLDLFTTTLSTMAVRRVTNTNGVPGIGNGIGLRTRVAGDGTLLFGVSTGDTGAPLFDRITGVRRSLLDGTISDVALSITGMAHEASRDRASVLVARHTSVGGDGTFDAQLVLRSASAGAERTLLASGQIIAAEFDATDRYALGLIDHWTAASDVHSYEWRVVEIATGAVESVEIPRVASAAITSALYVGRP